MAQPALGSIGDAARWRDSFGCAALADTDGDDDMRAVILKKVALRKRRSAAADGGGDGGFWLYIRTPSLEIEGVFKEKTLHIRDSHNIKTPFHETTNNRINANFHVLRQRLPTL